MASEMCLLKSNYKIPKQKKGDRALEVSQIKYKKSIYSREREIEGEMERGRENVSSMRTTIMSHFCCRANCIKIEQQLNERLNEVDTLIPFGLL